MAAANEEADELQGIKRQVMSTIACDKFMTAVRKSNEAKTELECLQMYEDEASVEKLQQLETLLSATIAKLKKMSETLDNFTTGGLGGR